MGRYDKRHLVPFGEYVPLQRVFFFLDKLVTGIGDFGRGEAATVFVGGSGRFSAMICYEVIFPAEVREFTRAGAQFLVNITNDAWFGRSGAPYQHLAMAAMRAVENGSFSDSGRQHRGHGHHCPDGRDPASDADLHRGRTDGDDPPSTGAHPLRTIW